MVQVFFSKLLDAKMHGAESRTIWEENLLEAAEDLRLE